MAGKRLEPGSEYEVFDADGDGVVSDHELEMSEKMQILIQQAERADAQKNMCWFALLGMVVYPSSVMVSSFFDLNDAATLLSDMANMYFLATGGVVSVFFGAQAYEKTKNGDG